MEDTRDLQIALELVNKAVDRGDFPGSTVAIGNSKDVQTLHQYGNASLYPKAKSLNMDILYDLASLTKVLGSTLLYMKFIEEGLVTFHDKVADYIPEFKGNEKSEITLFNLLTHTSGLVPHIPLYKLCKNPNDAIGYISNMELEHMPGTKVLYSDLGFILLGHILETVGGSGLDELCKRYIWDPLGMKNTCFNPKTDNVVPTEKDKTTGEIISGRCHDENGRFLGGISGHAGLFSNIEDMIKLASMLINRGEAEGSAFISLPTFEAMTKNYTADLNEDRGIGWCVKGSKGRVSSGGDLISPNAFGHTGFTGTSIWIDRERDTYIILLTNRVNPTRDNNAIIRFRQIFHNAVLSH